MLRRPARFLAPLALVAVVIAILLIVGGSGGGRSTSTGGTASPSGVSAAGARTRHGRRTYVVRAGDSLSGIAVRNGVSVAQIQSLNPGLDPSALPLGRRLRLRR